MEDNAIAAMDLEDSVVMQDLAALHWHDGALSAPKGPALGESQPNHLLSDANFLNDLPNDLHDPAATISSETSQAGHIFYHPAEGVTDFMGLSADDCYRPDLSMILAPESVEALGSPSLHFPDSSSALCSQEDTHLVNGYLVLEQPVGTSVTQPYVPPFCFEEHLLQEVLPLSDRDKSGSANQEGQSDGQSSHDPVPIVMTCDGKEKFETEAGVTELFPPYFYHILEPFSSKVCKVLFINGHVVEIPDPTREREPLQAEHHLVHEPDTEQLMHLDHEEGSDLEEQSSDSSISSSGLVEGPGQLCQALLNVEIMGATAHLCLPLSKPDSNVLGIQENCQAQLQSESGGEYCIIEKFAREALELKLHHSLVEEDDLSDIELLYGTPSEESMPAIANELEENQTSDSYKLPP